MGQVLHAKHAQALTESDDRLLRTPGHAALLVEDAWAAQLHTFLAAAAEGLHAQAMLAAGTAHPATVVVTLAQGDVEEAAALQRHAYSQAGLWWGSAISLDRAEQLQGSAFLQADMCSARLGIVAPPTQQGLARLASLLPILGARHLLLIADEALDEGTLGPVSQLLAGHSSSLLVQVGCLR